MWAALLLHSGCLLKKFVLSLATLSLAAPVAIAYAYDFGTAATVAGLAGAGVGLTMMVGAAPALATVAIGAAVMGISFDKNETGGVPIAVQISPGAKLDTPAGWTEGANSDPIPPGSVPKSVTTWNTSGRYASTPQASCNLLAASFGTTGTLVPSGSNFECWFYDAKKGDTVGILGCPSGYQSASPTHCSLTDPSVVQKPSDDVCTIKRTGNSFAVDPNDPDCANKPATVAVQPNYVSQTKPDGTTKTVTINGDGSATVTESRPNLTTNTTETNTTHISAPNASGVSMVTGQASGSVNGTGTAAGNTPIPQFDKSGLATEGTLGGIKSDTAAIKDALTGVGVDSSLNAQKSAFDSAMDGIAALFSAETTKSPVINDDFSFGGYLPAQCGCSPLTMTILGKTRSYDWCSPMATFRDAFAWVLGILTAFYVLSLFRLGGGK